MLRCICHLLAGIAVACDVAATSLMVMLGLSASISLIGSDGVVGTSWW
jgi:hypothetical protein